MKIIILTAIKEWVLNKIKFGATVWKDAAEAAGFGVEKFNSPDNYSSTERIKKLIEEILLKAFLSEEDFKTQFIEFWMTDFAPRFYQSLLKSSNNAKEFFTTITRVNNEICVIFPGNPRLSRVDLTETDDYTVTAVYASEKSLVDIISILRGSSRFHNDSYSIKKINMHSAEIKFDAR